MDCDHIHGDGHTFDGGVDCHACAAVKFLTEQGAPELAPYLCPADIFYNQALSWGLKRTATLAGGTEWCNFRFQRGGETRVAVPEPLAEFLRSSQP